MWHANLKLVLPDRVIEQGSFRVEHGLIAEIREGAPNDPRAVNWRGMTALPGLVDAHGDMLEREIEPRPGARIPFDMAVHELDKRLAANGITTAYAAISFAEISLARHIRREETARQIAHAICDHRANLHVDIRVHARFEVTNRNAPVVILDLLRDGAVHMVSLNDHTPGQGQYRDIEKYILTMAEWRHRTSDQVEEMTLARIQAAQATPRAWDVVREVTALALRNAIPIASHDDDTQAKVDLMREMGASISEFPVTLEAAEAARRHGMRVAMGAPNALRGVSTSGNLSARDAIAAGLVDMLASDYHPPAMLQAAYLIARLGLLPLHEAIRMVSVNAARASGLTDRGELSPGKRADFVLVDESGLPKVRATYRDGHAIYMDKVGVTA